MVSAETVKKPDFSKKPSFGNKPSGEGLSERFQTERRKVFGSRIGLKNLAQMLHRVATGLRAGVDVRRVWNDETRIGPAKQREMMAVIEEYILAGDTVTEGMRATDGYFPPLTSELVEVGK